MRYYVLTDYAGENYRCKDGWYMEIRKGECAPAEVERFRTKADATKAAAKLKKKDAYLKVERRDVVVVIVRDGISPPMASEFPSAAKAKSFQREMAREGFETAIEVTRPAKRKAAR